VRDIELGGERIRGVYLLKSRGMAHSNRIREFKLTDHGIELAEWKPKNNRDGGEANLPGTDHTLKDKVGR
jgi:hypothetical protein